MRICATHAYQHTRPSSEMLNEAFKELKSYPRHPLTGVPPHPSFDPARRRRRICESSSLPPPRTAGTTATLDDDLDSHSGRVTGGTRRRGRGLEGTTFPRCDAETRTPARAKIYETLARSDRTRRQTPPPPHRVRLLKGCHVAPAQHETPSRLPTVAVDWRRSISGAERRRAGRNGTAERAEWPRSAGRK